jgi:transposase
VRNGTTTLFAALDVATGTVIGRLSERHRHEEYLRFLHQVDRETPRRRDLNLVVDNYATHKHPEVQAWLQEHPRFHVHFTPTGSSWLSLVERWFSQLTTRRLRRGAFRSVRELTTAIREYIAINNQDPKPFRWTKGVKEILRNVNCHLKVTHLLPSQNDPPGSMRFRVRSSLRTPGRGKDPLSPGGEGVARERSRSLRFGSG